MLSFTLCECCWKKIFNLCTVMIGIESFYLNELILSTKYVRDHKVQLREHAMIYAKLVCGLQLL